MGAVIISFLYMRKLRHGIDCLTNLIKIMLQISGNTEIQTQAVWVQSSASQWQGFNMSAVILRSRQMNC